MLKSSSCPKMRSEKSGECTAKTAKREEREKQRERETVVRNSPEAVFFLTGGVFFHGSSQKQRAYSVRAFEPQLFRCKSIFQFFLCADRNGSLQ